MTGREDFLFWRLAHYLMAEQGYSLIRLTETHAEIWLENRSNKRSQIIRLVRANLDWANWLKRDIQVVEGQSERLRKHLFARRLEVLNVYVTPHAPVDDYDHAVNLPDKQKKTNVHTILYSRETEDEAEKAIRVTVGGLPDFHLREEYEEPEVEMAKQAVLQLAEKQEKETRQLFQHGKPFFTYLFMAVQILVFFLLEAKGGSTNTETLIEYGAKYNPLILAGEWWRFFTPIFLHIGFIHLAMNTLALFYLGSDVERIFGRLRFLWIYIFSGFAGCVASFVFSSNLSAGASGAIFGCFGALLFLGVSNPKLFFRTMGMNVIVLIGINLVFGFTVPGIDNAGHLGGLAGGFLATGIVHLPGRKKWGLQGLFTLAAAAAVAGMLYIGYHNDRPSAINGLAQEQIQKGEIGKAHEMLTAYVEEGKGDAVTYFQLSFTEIQLKKYTDAREHLETAIKLNPDFHEAHYNLALLYYNEGNRQQAVEHAERAYSLSGDKKYKEFLDKHGR